MTEKRPRRTALRLALPSAGAAAVLAAACATPHPPRPQRVPPELYAQVTAIVDSQLRVRDRERSADASALLRRFDAADTGATRRADPELYDRLRRMLDTLNAQNGPYGGRKLYHLLDDAASDLQSRPDPRLDSALRARLVGGATAARGERPFVAAPRSRAAVTDSAAYARLASDSAVAVDGGCAVNESTTAPRTLVILVPPNAGAGAVRLRRLTTARAADVGLEGLERGGAVIRERGDAAGDDLRCWSSAERWRVRVSALAFARPDARLYLVSDEPVAVMVREPGGRVIAAPSTLDARVDSATFEWRARGRDGAMTGWGTR